MLFRSVHQSLADKVKTADKKQEKVQAGNKINAEVDTHQPHFENVLGLHHHIQAAKNELVKALSANPNYEHRVGEQEVKPEGHVAVIGNRPTKLVDRAEFSKLNFAKNAQ